MQDQDRAKKAFEHVNAVTKKDDAFKRKYATFVHKMPALISSAGLCQAVWYIKSRKEEAGERLLDDLSSQLKRVDPELKDGQGLTQRVHSAPLELYLRLTQEAFLCSAWYRRMVQGVLKIEAADTGDDN